MQDVWLPVERFEELQPRPSKDVGAKSCLPRTPQDFLGPCPRSCQFFKLLFLFDTSLSVCLCRQFESPFLEDVLHSSHRQRIVLRTVCFRISLQNVVSHSFHHRWEMSTPQLIPPQEYFCWPTEHEHDSNSGKRENAVGQATFSASETTGG